MRFPKPAMILVVLLAGTVVAVNLIRTNEENPRDGVGDSEPPHAEVSKLAVKFVGAGLTEGRIWAMLFDNEQDFLNRRNPLQRCECDLSDSGDASCEFTGLPKGKYVIMAYLDRNLNSQLDQNALGLPTEPYGFSNNARRPFGPPAFEECVFEFEDASRLEIELR